MWVTRSLCEQQLVCCGKTWDPFKDMIAMFQDHVSSLISSIYTFLSEDM